MSEEKDYSTSDFYTAAVLIAFGFELTDITPSTKDSKVKIFHFADSDELRNTRMMYANGKLLGNIKKFKQAVEEVKELLHS